MSGFAFLKMTDRLVVITDAGNWLPQEDRGRYVLNALHNKAHVFPHLDAVFAGQGTGEFCDLLKFNHGGAWKSFDHMVECFRDDVEKTLHHIHRYKPGRKVACRIALGGWSTARNRFETYSIFATDEEVSDDNRHVSVLSEMGELFTSPDPNHQSLERMGLLREGKPHLDIQYRDGVPDLGDLHRFVQAMRFTPTPMGKDFDNAPLGSCLAGFIQQTTIFSGGTVLSQIVHRWSDPIDEPVDGELNPIAPRQV